MRDERDILHETMLTAVTARIATVRGDMTDAEFGQLIADMVRTAQRFAEIDKRLGCTPIAMGAGLVRPKGVDGSILAPSSSRPR